MSREPFIVYDPPPGGQVLRVAGATEAWERVSRFLRTCTDADPDAPNNVKLTLYEPSDRDLREWYEPSLQAAEARFGPGERRAWTAGVREDFCVEWRLASRQATEARAYLAAGAPWPQTEMQAVGLTLGFTFRWVDPVTGVLLPGQEVARRAHPVQAASDLLLGLGRRSWVSLDLRFPFPAADDAFLAYLEWVAGHAPAPLLAGRFRHWLPTKRPTQLGYTARKVSPGLLDGIAR